MDQVTHGTEQDGMDIKLLRLAGNWKIYGLFLQFSVQYFQTVVDKG